MKALLLALALASTSFPTAEIGKRYAFTTKSGTVTGTLVSDDGTTLTLKILDFTTTVLVADVILTELADEAYAPPPEPPAPAAEDHAPPAIAIDAKYDKFNDETVISFSFTSCCCELDAASLVASKGDSERNPLLGSIGFHYSGDEWKYLKTARRIVFLADGKRFETPMTHDGDVRSGGNISEFMWANMLYADFEKIANAKSVEFQIGTTECVLADNVRASLAELAKRTKPAAKPAATPPEFKKAPPPKKRPK